MMIRKLCLLALLPAYAMAADPAPATPSGSLLTRADAEAQVKHADELRKDAKLRKDEAETIRLRDYNACLSKVLVNACRDDVRQTFIKTMDGIRKQEIEANQLNREAKARLNELNDAGKQAPKPGARPASQGDSQRSLPKPYGKPSSTAPQGQSAPSPTVSPAAQARADADKARKTQAAEQQRASNATAASKRAEQASQDREKYVRRQQEHAEKMAKRASRSSKKADTSAPAGK